MNILLTENGQIITRSVRRCAQPWRRHVIAGLVTTPWYNKVIKTQRFLEAPTPAILEKPMPDDEAASNPPSDPEDKANVMPNAELAEGPPMDHPTQGVKHTQWKRNLSHFLAYLWKIWLMIRSLERGKLKRASKIFKQQMQLDPSPVLSLLLFLADCILRSLLGA